MISSDVLFEGPFINVGGLSYDVSPDGQRFLLLQERELEPSIEIRVVENWFGELNRLVPTD